MKRRCLFALFFCSLTLCGRGGVSVTTWQMDLQHTGANLQETVLNPRNVGSNHRFGYLFSQPVDGQVYAQPLVVSGIEIGGQKRDVVYVATEHDSVYALDASGSSAAPLWRMSLLEAGARPLPVTVAGSSDISGEIGITATPVIDSVSQTLYAVAKVQEVSDGSCRLYLHALDLATGAERPGSPVQINPIFHGNASEGRNGAIPFNALREHSRAAVILHDGVVYVTFGSLSDAKPYHGEVLGFDAKTLRSVCGFITTPNSDDSGGGIWQGGAGPAVDEAGNLYFMVADGPWDQVPSRFTRATDWGESVLKFRPSSGEELAVDFNRETDWFTPYNWRQLNKGDLDLGSCGLLLLPTGRAGRQWLIAGGKAGVLYVLDRDNLGGKHEPNKVVQEVRELGSHWLFATPAWFNGSIYYAPAGGPLVQRRVDLDAEVNPLASIPIVSARTYDGKGAGVFISANGERDGIAWLLNGSGLDAYDATNISGAPLFSARALSPSGRECRTPKFGLPTVANGKVYLTATDDANETHLFVLGLLSEQQDLAAPSGLAATALSSRAIALRWNAPSSPPAGFTILRSLGSSDNFTSIGTVPGATTSFTDKGLHANTAYRYKVAAFNSRGDSKLSAEADATTKSYLAEDHLVAAWDFEDDSQDILDVTGNGHNGRLLGEVVACPGRSGSAYVFHGTGNAEARIVVPDFKPLRLEGNRGFTLVAWVKPSRVEGEEQAVIAKADDRLFEYGLMIDTQGRWSWRTTSSNHVGSHAVAGQWACVALVHEAGSEKCLLYVDGKQAAAGVLKSDSGSGALSFGQIDSSDPESFAGIIDDVRIYDDALNAAKIEALAR